MQLSPSSAVVTPKLPEKPFHCCCAYSGYLVAFLEPIVAEDKVTESREPLRWY
jgi:hypothetical protein